VERAVTEEWRVVWVLELNMIREVLKTGTHGYRMSFHHSLLRKHPAGKQRSIKNKRLKEPNILLPIDLST
jgi:hypothetical protein